MPAPVPAVAAAAVEEESSKPQCALCLDDMQEGLCTVPCGHVFHYECMRDTFRKGFKKCPTCRKLVRAEKSISKIFLSW